VPLSDEASLEEVASALSRAERERRSIEPPSATRPDLTVDDAYAIQRSNIQRRIAAGAELRGHKIGLTAKVMQELFGVHEPDFGHLLDDMVLADGATVPTAEYVQPMVEIEPAVILRSRLQGPGVTPEQVADAIEWVLPSIEVIDSRIHDWRTGIVDTVADNGSSALVVVGEPRLPLEEASLGSQRARLLVDGREVASGDTAEIMGDPLVAIAWLANAVGGHGVPLEAGHLILPGTCIAAVRVEPGHTYTASFDVLGTVEVTFA
jgi:2-keto-4-pentenoate hydratase